MSDAAEVQQDALGEKGCDPKLFCLNFFVMSSAVPAIAAPCLPQNAAMVASLLYSAMI